MARFALLFLFFISLSSPAHAARVYDDRWPLDYSSATPDNELNSFLGTNLFNKVPFREFKSPPQTKATNTNSANIAANNNPRVAGASIANAAGTATGTVGSLALSLALGFLIAILYTAYARTNLFQKREVLATIKKQSSDKNRFNFAR